MSEPNNYWIYFWGKNYFKKMPETCAMNRFSELHPPFDYCHPQLDPTNHMVSVDHNTSFWPFSITLIFMSSIQKNCND